MNNYMSDTHKGSWDRLDPMKKNQSEYWKPENFEKRRIAKEIHSITKYEQAVKAMLDEQVVKMAQADGWKDIHGGDHGAYWRGINPDTGRCEKLPDKYLQTTKKETKL